MTENTSRLNIAKVISEQYRDYVELSKEQFIRDSEDYSDAINKFIKDYRTKMNNAGLTLSETGFTENFDESRYIEALKEFVELYEQACSEYNLYFQEQNRNIKTAVCDVLMNYDERIRIIGIITPSVVIGSICDPSNGIADWLDLTPEETEDSNMADRIAAHIDKRGYIFDDQVLRCQRVKIFRMI